MIESCDLFEIFTVVAQQRTGPCGGDVIHQRLRFSRKYNFDICRTSLSRRRRWSAHTAGHILDSVGDKFGKRELQPCYGRANLRAPATDLPDQRRRLGVRLYKLMDLAIDCG